MANAPKHQGSSDIPERGLIGPEAKALTTGI